VATAPDIEENTTDYNQQACAVSDGLARWYVAKCVSSINIVKAASDAGANLADQATDLLDSIPIFGAALNNILDVLQDMAVAGDYTDIIGLITDPDFIQQVQCKLYCELKAAAVLTQATVQAASEAMFNWAALLPPGGPFLTFYGQAFALFGTSISPQVAWRSAFIHSDERSDDCETLCTDCLDTPDSFDHTDDFSTGMSGWGVQSGGHANFGGSPTHWGGNNTGGQTVIQIDKAFAFAAVVNDIYVDYEVANQGGNRPTVILKLSGTQVFRYDSPYSAGTDQDETLHISVGGINADYILVVVDNQSVTTNNIFSIRVTGEGADPLT